MITGDINLFTNKGTSVAIDMYKRVNTETLNEFDYVHKIDQNVLTKDCFVTNIQNYELSAKNWVNTIVK